MHTGALLVFTCGAATAADWKLEKTIEFIVPTGPGSGVDASARTVQQLFQSNKLVEQAINTINKPGGNYGIAMKLRRQHGILKDVLSELGMVQ